MRPIGRLRTAAAAVLAFAMAGADAARAGEPGLRIEVLAAGRYLTEQTGDLAHQQGPPDTAEVAGTGRGSFVEQGERLVVNWCDNVGIRFRAPDVPAYNPVPVTIEVEHPPVLFPDGPHRRDSWRTTVDLRPRTLGVTFEEEAMMQPGTWTISVLQNGRVLAVRRFELSVPPDLGPGPADCTPKIS